MTDKKCITSKDIVKADENMNCPIGFSFFACRGKTFIGDMYGVFGQYICCRNEIPVYPAVKIDTFNGTFYPTKRINET